MNRKFIYQLIYVGVFLCCFFYTIQLININFDRKSDHHLSFFTCFFLCVANRWYRRLPLSGVLIHHSLSVTTSSFDLWVAGLNLAPCLLFEFIGIPGVRLIANFPNLGYSLLHFYLYNNLSISLLLKIDALL